MKDLVPSFASLVHTAPVEMQSEVLTLNIFVDKSSVEVFAEGVSIVLTDLFYGEGTFTRLEVYAFNGTAYLEHLDLWKFSSIWGS